VSAKRAFSLPGFKKATTYYDDEHHHQQAECIIISKLNARLLMDAQSPVG
jgi:hypothetical protein